MQVVEENQMCTNYAIWIYWIRVFHAELVINIWLKAQINFNCQVPTQQVCPISG
jgi:hypothetical protein